MSLSRATTRPENTEQDRAKVQQALPMSVIFPQLLDLRFLFLLWQLIFIKIIGINNCRFYVPTFHKPETQSFIIVKIVNHIKTNKTLILISKLYYTVYNDTI